MIQNRKEIQVYFLRFETWHAMPESCCVDAVEVYIRRKARLVPGFPQKEASKDTKGPTLLD